MLIFCVNCLHKRYFISCELFAREISQDWHSMRNVNYFLDKDAIHLMSAEFVRILSMKIFVLFFFFFL